LRDKPHIDREEGGHLVLDPIKSHLDRTTLSHEEASELMKLTMVFGKAMAVGLRKRGIKIARINYQDNGNWALKEGKKGHLHVHLYGRAKDSTFQEHGEALYFPAKGTPVYDSFEKLNAGDIKAILLEAKKLLSSKYKDW